MNNKTVLIALTGGGIRCQVADSNRQESIGGRELQHKHAAAAHILPVFHRLRA